MTKEMLNNQVKMLNSYANAKYALYWAYGKVQLVRVYDHGGKSGITGFCTKKELSDILGALITYSSMEKVQNSTLIWYNYYRKKKEVHKMKRGEIYYADLSPTKGSEQGGIRPVLIIQNDVGNKYSPTTIVAPLTSQLGKKSLPTHILLDNWVGTKSVILLEQVKVIDKSRLQGKPIYRLDDMREVDKALTISLGLAATEV